MTVILKDSNDYNAKELFDSRQAYKENSFIDIPEKNKTILYEHFFENQNYGKVDQYGNAIFVSERFLKGTKSSIGGLILVHNFVSDAFADMSEYFKSAYRLRKIKIQGSPYSQLQPVAGFSSMHKAYANYLSKFNLVLIEYLKEIKAQKTVLNFDDYIRYFLNFLSIQKGLIIFTRSKFITSKFTNQMITGLSLSLDGENYDNDLAKYNKFYLDPNFPFFLETCRRFSFLVDKNAPWTVHFDFNNPYSSEYLKKYIPIASPPNLLKNKEKIFETRYYKAFFTDIKILKTFLHHSYISFILNENSYSLIEDVTECGNPIIKREERPEISLKKVETEYNNIYWLKLYFRIRLLEERLELQPAKYNKTVLDMENILKYGTTATSENRYESALAYLNSFLLSLVKQPSPQQLLTF
jgi:hypothetical protein